ncbi:xanthine dehydrogenase family protein molybdopterin-binding subunit [Xanthobacteraceae bacterium Astr-EGSB]|uniref:xanthine dehydrogenase family protein molybdopterin-binding subunit n=1 Tax=Astrobacterium formosum TaxID=3069710 RepID=UPI0027B407B5|nr:xanthine dehydrogenase family protein molybdopterin-binding subunit [Xanthobacteraceae bacterium Astr-EGSB]
MTDAIEPTSSFPIGRAEPRREDPMLLRGLGHYTDDLALPRQAYAAMVRSPHAHGIIRGIDTEAAAAMAGVIAVYTGTDLSGYAPLPCRMPINGRDGRPILVPDRPALATERVRFVGDAFACVIAETAAQARDAAEAVGLDIDPLPAVTKAGAAAAPDAPLLYDNVPGNLVLDYHFGDSDAVAAAFATAAHVTRLTLTNNRLVPTPLEPRVAIGEFDPQSGRFTLHVPSQGVMGMRAQLAIVLDVAPDRVRVLTTQVGGSFGMKASLFPEYVCVLHAARMLGRPVKWTDDRAGAFLTDTHGRDGEWAGELALDAKGRFLAVRATGYANLGAAVGMVGAVPSALNIGKNIVGPYRTPLIEVTSRCLVTNTTPVGAYRGAGRPEGNYILERLIDTAARQMGIDRIALRRRNHIKPADLPYAAPSDLTYDSGDYPAVFDRALELADIKGFAARKRVSRKAGLLRGLGIGSYLEATAPATPESGAVRFEPDGGVTLLTGTLDYGQGHGTPFAQVLASRLGIPAGRIRLVQGDSDLLAAGGGSGGSRSIMASGAAIVACADLVITNGRQIAAALLEAATDDIEFAAGRFTIAGTDRGIGLLEMADSLRKGVALPEGVPQSLDAGTVIDGVPSAFPNGCHVAEVEIDPDTGRARVAKYTSVNDFGTVVNPMIVEGQLHGGVVQGLGQVFHERVVYDSDGQLLTGSLMDYGLPRAEDVPDLVGALMAKPATTNPLGAKGCGEAGCAGALVAVVNGVVDALAEYGITHVDMPITPEGLWGMIRDARARPAA